MQTPVASLTALRFTHLCGLATPTFAHEAESGSLSLRLTSSPFDGCAPKGYSGATPLRLPEAPAPGLLQTPPGWLHVQTGNSHGELLTFHKINQT